MRMTRMIGTLLILTTANFCTAQESSSRATSSNASTGSEPADDSKTTVDGGAELASPDAAPTDPNLEAVRAGAKEFVDAFNKADASAIAMLWTEDGEYVDAAGNTFTGRPAIQKAYEDFFRENQGAKLRIHIDSFKLLSETAATEDGSTLVEIPPAIAALGRYTAVHVKVDGKWLMASVRDTLIEATVAESSLADLDWLNGKWVAEEHGNKTVSSCHWIGQRGFIQRDFTTTLFDGTKTSGVELIGWNALGGFVQSWTFNADGSHAVGAWTSSPKGWVAQMQGTTADGIPTSSTHLLNRLDDNAYSWQSVNRFIGGVAVPDSDEVVIKRQPETK